MIDYKVIIVLSLVLATFLSLAYIDSKYKLNILAWLNGEKSAPFNESKHQSLASWNMLFTEEDPSLQKENKHLKQEVEVLRERVQVLEKIVTEPAYELNKKLNDLA